MTESGPDSDMDGTEIPQCSGVPAPVQATFGRSADTDGLPQPRANSRSFASLLTCGESITELEKSGVRE